MVVEAEGPDGVTFDFHDEEGRLRGSVAAPERDPRVPPYFRDDRLYVVTQDSLGVQRVASYRIGSR